VRDAARLQAQIALAAMPGGRLKTLPNQKPAAVSSLQFAPSLRHEFGTFETSVKVNSADAAHASYAKRLEGFNGDCPELSIWYRPGIPQFFRIVAGQSPFPGPSERIQTET